MAKLKNKIILITGAAGFIGRELSDYLIENNYKVRKMIRGESFKYLNPIINEETIYGDVTNLDSLIKATRDVSVVVNLAAKKLDEKDSFDVNILGVKNLLKACRINSVKKIIQISSVSAKIPKKGVYGKTKAMADEMISMGSIPYIILRVSLVYGPELGGIFGSIVKFSKLPIIPVFGNGKWISNPIHTQDLSKAIEKAIVDDKLENQIWDVGGREKIEFDALVKKIASFKNFRPTIIHIPMGIGLVLANLLSFLKNPPITVSNILGSTQNVKLDIKKFLKDFDINPIPLEKGLSEVLYNKEDQYPKEAEILSNYVLSASNTGFKADKQFLINYQVALKSAKILKKDKFSLLVIKYPGLLGAVEIYLRIFSPNATLLKKIYIMTALLECHPVTSDWILPKEKKSISLFYSLFLIGIKLGCKIALSLFLIPFLNIYDKNKK